MSISRTLSVQSAAIPLDLGRPALEPIRLSGREGLNSLFEYELLLKTPDSLDSGFSQGLNFNLDDFIGREISCSIELDGSGEFVPGSVGDATDRVGAGFRQINALIAGAAALGEEGRHAQYKLMLRPWLHLATLRTDWKIFQNKSVVEILDELLAKYNFPVVKRLVGPGGAVGPSYPQRDYQTQYNESDFAFFERLCQEWGISYHFEHGEGAHRLVLADAKGSYSESESAAYRRVKYHAPGWKTDSEYIHSFVAEHCLTSGSYATRDYDYSRPRADLSHVRHDPRPTGQADGEVYQWHDGRAGSHYAQPNAGTARDNATQDEGRLLALLRLEALRTHGARAKARGNLRGMVPGRTFMLHAHPRDSANAEYLILDTHFLIEDVGTDSQIKDAAPHRRQEWRVEVDLTAHPAREPLRPELKQAKPFTRGPQSAVVVGPEGQNIWTDELGRIKVQFPWDRIGQKNQHSSCWLRVAGPWAGNQLGGIHIPRVGQEVIVDFLGGDPDLPICMGRVHNQVNLPPWSLPGQSALSGYRSRELVDKAGNGASGRSNHLVFDDTAGSIQAQLKSDDQHSQLSLGRITRIENNAGRKDFRGLGFELRSDGHGALRAGNGMLITTEPRFGARAHALDCVETVQRLSHALEQHERLAATAQEAGAQQGGADQSEVAEALRVQNEEIRGKAGGAQDEESREFTAPHLVLASPAGIGTTTPGSTHVASGEHVALTSGRHTSVSSGGSLLASARGAIRLFAREMGVRLISASEDIDIKALKKGINLFARLDITITAERITIGAKEEVLVNGGGSYTLWKAGLIEDGTTGSIRRHAATYSDPGPRSGPGLELPVATVAEDGLAMSLVSYAGKGHMFANEPYQLYRGGALVAKGMTDAHGRIEVKKHAAGTPFYKARLTNGAEFDLRVSEKLRAEDLQQQQSNAGIRRALDAASRSRS